MVVAMLAAAHDFIALLVSHDFWVNFLANLGGALVGVWLAFWIERRRSRRDAERVYGHMLRSARSELGYLHPMCVHIRDRIKTGGSITRESFNVPATTAVLISPMTHERAPYSLVMALTTASLAAEATADGLREAVRISEPLLSKQDQPTVAAKFKEVRHALQTSVDRLQGVVGVALELLDAEITRLGVKARPDPATEVVSTRLRAILRPTRSDDEPTAPANLA